MNTNLCNEKIYKGIRKLGVLFVLLCFVLTGCYKKYDTDYVKKYNRFLRYSLGEFKVIDKRIIKWRADPIPTHGEGISWDIEYFNQQNERKVFSFQNYGNTKGGDSSNFGYAVLIHAISLGKEQLINNILRRYFNEDEIGSSEYETNATKTSADVLGYYPNSLGDKYYESTLDLNNGIILKSITAKQLSKEWKYNYEFEVNTRIEEEMHMSELKSKIENMMRSLFDYFDNDEITVDLNGKDENHSYRASYSKETDSFVWQVLADI